MSDSTLFVGTKKYRKFYQRLSFRTKFGLSCVVVLVAMLAVDLLRPEKATGSGYTEIWQTPSAFDASGFTGWNGTVAVICDPSGFFIQKCWVAAFHNNQDFPPNSWVTRSRVEFSRDVLMKAISKTELFGQWTHKEICLYGGCYGVHAFEAACSPDDRMEWRMFGGCRLVSEHVAMHGK